MGKSSTSFTKGKTGNPGGRPKTHMEVRRMARRQTKAAIACLIDAMKNATKLHVSMTGNTEHPDYRVRVMAAEALLNRGHGAPMRAEQAWSQEEQTKILSMQAKKLELETKILQQKLEADFDGDVTADDEEISAMLREKFGHAREMQ